MQVCIIDDDPFYQMVLKKMLRNYGIETPLRFEDGMLAMAYFSNLAPNTPLPDVVLLDLNMPDMDGWEFLDLMSQRAGLVGVRLFVVSSSINPEDQVRALSYPLVEDFLVKPITHAKLGEILAACP